MRRNSVAWSKIRLYGDGNMFMREILPGTTAVLLRNRNCGDGDGTDLDVWFRGVGDADDGLTCD